MWHQIHNELGGMCIVHYWVHFDYLGTIRSVDSKDSRVVSWFMYLLKYSK